MLRANVAAATLLYGGGTLDLEQDQDPTQMSLFERFVELAVSKAVVAMFECWGLSEKRTNFVLLEDG